MILYRQLFNNFHHLYSKSSSEENENKKNELNIKFDAY